MNEPRIIKISVNDPEVPDSYRLLINGRSYDLIQLLAECSKEEHTYLLLALEQAKGQQKQ